MVASVTALRTDPRAWAMMFDEPLAETGSMCQTVLQAGTDMGPAYTDRQEPMMRGMIFGLCHLAKAMRAALDRYIPRFPLVRTPDMDACQHPNPFVVLPCPAKNVVLATLHELSPEFAVRGVTRICLFGSVARGDDTPESDIDIAVQMPADIRALCNIRAIMESHFNRRVDLMRLPFHAPLDKTAPHDAVTV